MQLLSPAPNGEGYRTVSLRKNNRGRSCYVSHLVAQAFLGPRPKNKVVAHSNDNKTDDSVKNIAYKTHAENMADKIKNGRQRHGSKTAKLHERDIPVIRDKLARGLSQSAIAREYEVTPATIRDIAHERTWVRAR